MLIVTGGAGFIGSNLVRELIDKTGEKVLVVDDLSNGKKYQNISNLNISDYLDYQEFIDSVDKNQSLLKGVKCIFHQGACTDTTEWDGRYMMKTNFTFSKKLLHASIESNVRFIYASSAAVYGSSKDFNEHEDNEDPLNVYGYSKLLFDQYVRNIKKSKGHQIAGLRYFNVYGPGEKFKKSMASVIHHFNSQIKKNGVVNLFKGSHGYEDGEQRRDFIFVNDVCSVNLWLYKNSHISGIFNLGTGASSSFNQVAKEVINWHKKGTINYIDFPEDLIDTYQAHTKANIDHLRKAGYEGKFTDIHDGIKQYLDQIVD